MEMCGRINYMILRMGFLQLNMEAGSDNRETRIDKFISLQSSFSIP